MRRRITMGLLALGVVGGFGMELHRMKACGGGGCPDDRRASFASVEQQAAPADPQAAASDQKSEHQKGGHCNGWKKSWAWGQEKQPEPTPETAITTAQK
jgi:hypothetical protein